MASIYLDHAAATPLDTTVLAAMEPFFSDVFYNPSAIYQAARDTHRSIESARSDVARLLGARPSEVIFTAGGSESDNMAIHGIMRRYTTGNVVVSAIEHDAVLAPARRYDHRIAAVGPDGMTDLQQLATSIDDATVLVSIMYANNEIGTVQPIAKISQLVREVRSRRREQGNDMPLFFHTDACQAANYLDVHVSRLGVDLLTLNGGKVYGPKQSGALYIKGGLQLEPLIDGGGQERGLRSGTENVAGCVGLAVALEQAQAMRAREVQRLQQLQKSFLMAVEKQIPLAVIQGSRKHRLPNNIHLSLPGYDNERLLYQLDDIGIQAAAGSACSASDDTPSHVLKAIGLSDSDARSSLRFTMGRSTTEEQVGQTVDALERLVA